jgi:hypothetical protein
LTGEVIGGDNIIPINGKASYPSTRRSCRLCACKHFIGKLIVVANEYNLVEVGQIHIVGVCSHRGCWVDIASDAKFDKLRIKDRDGDMVFPLLAKK